MPNDCTKKHKQVAIEYGRNKAEVDEGLADLILAMWRAGIDTDLSCQENFKNIAWIAFPTQEDIRLLSVVIFDADRQYFYNKIESQSRTLRSVAKDDKWYTSLDIMERCKFVSEDEVEGTGDIDISFSIRFPAADIPFITQAVQDWNKELSNA
jgi:hypothetical protein